MGKKIFVLDTNLSAVYRENVNLEKFLRLLKILSDKHYVVITSNGWYEQAVQICNLFQNHKIDIISGGGSSLKHYKLPIYEYSGFINKNDADLILHLAIASYSGVIVKGRKHGDNHTNVMLNYFLNFQGAKEFRGIWKLNFDLNNDYLSFESKLNDIDVSEIYVFGNNPNFPIKFFDASHKNPNDLIHQRNVRMSPLLKANYLFTSKMCSKAHAITNYVDNVFLKFEDVVYISLGEIDEIGIHRYGQIILPMDIPERLKTTATFVYDTKNPDDINNYLIHYEQTKSLPLTQNVEPTTIKK